MKQLATAIFLCGVALALQSCGQQDPSSENSAQAPASAPAAMPRSPAPPGAAVFFITPMNGATVSSPVTIKFGVSGANIMAAGNMAPNSGHHHLLVDTELADPSMPVPKDAQHLHYGKGQTETTLELAPGTHSLQMVLGDGNHVPHDPPIMSGVISITVE
ncbi:MAG: DUF4399 domain-containing protein [Gammaproteobacteria bacterium]